MCPLILLLAVPLAAFAAPPVLSLEEATRLAVERAPLLDAHRSQIEAAQQESRRAGALPDPTLAVGIYNMPVTGTDAFDVQADFMTMKRIGLRQEVPARAKREARRSLAARNIDQAQADAQAEHLQVRRETAEAWIDLWATQRELRELIALREETELASRLARARVAGGTEPVADALAAEAALLELNNRIEAARASETAAQVELARWLGEGPLLFTDEAPDFTALPVSEARLLAALDRLGPLLPTTAEIEAAAAEVDLARAEKRPDWSVAASYGQRGGDRSDMLMLEFGIELPLFTRNRQDRGVAARQAEYQATLARREDLRRQQAARIRADVARWEGFKAQVARDRSALLPLARDRAATALAAYRAGAPVRPWLDAQRDELDILIDHTQRLGALGRSWAALAYLLPEEPQR
ncbi:MAG: TolC family protein [Proteobacteria bacterium]|nr:TolC family protein [Pseudomonadota bacterium]